MAIGLARGISLGVRSKKPAAPAPARQTPRPAAQATAASARPVAAASPARAAPTEKVPGWRQFYGFMKEAIGAWQDDYAPSMGAALSYYTVFSIAPLLMIVISVAGLVFGEDAARGHITAQLAGFLGTVALAEAVA